MKKRLISLMLAVMTLFMVMLTSCSSSSDDDSVVNDINSEASRYTTTLNMYVVTEKETTAEAAAAVTEQINKLTKAKFKTQLNIYFYTEDVYYDVIEEKIEKIEADIAAEEEAYKALRQAQKEAKARGETLATTTVEETEETEEETVVNEWGLSELKYPEETARQMDIVFFSGYDRYLDYIDRDMLSRLDDELSSSSKKLKDYINPVFLDAAKINGSTYAIPNNHVIGEYTYLLINKELAEKYSYDTDSMTDLYFCMEFVEDVAKYEPDITPVCGKLELTNIKYMSIDHETLDFTGERSVMAAYVSARAGYGSRISYRNMFATTQITNQLIAIQTFKDKGYIDENGDPSKPFGIAVMKGSGELAEIYGEDYEMVVLENPMADEETLYAGMFGVTQYTKDLARSMEIITYLNTNAELRNLFQYGIENVNYVINEDGTLSRLNNTYMMDINKTGNAFVAYPEEGMSANAWESAKQQNIDARLDPMHGFTFVDSGLDLKYIEAVEALSKEYLPKLDACASVEELQAFIETAYTELAANQDLRSAASVMTENSPNAIYDEWYNTNWPSEG